MEREEKEEMVNRNMEDKRGNKNEKEREHDYKEEEKKSSS
jgi:hypothetical protein